MTQEIINVGTAPDDGQGDPLRTGFIKSNNNFSQLFSAILGNVSSLTYGNTSITIPFANGNIAVQVTGTSNVVVFSPSGQYVTGLVSATGNITGAYVLGNGSQLTGIGTDTAIVNGTSNVRMVTANGNVTVGVGGTTIGTFATTGEFVNGLISATGNIKAAGFTFANGQPVSTGAQGSTGSQGATGTQGAVGTQGIQGTQGLTGTGAQGATGTQGIQGVQGAIATQGATGAQGIQGTQGTQGTTGIQGIQGITGTQGIQGISDRFATTSSTSLTIGLGSKSLTVGTGLSYTVAQDIIIAFDINNHMNGIVSSYDSGTGAMVALIDTVTGSGTYAAWTINLDGATGIQGTTGAQGTQGITGVQGTVGTQGTQGTQGIQGITGVQGVQGVTGTQGTTGAQGIQGVQGITGAQGATGTQGAVGTQGTTGAQGIQGTTGTQGATGTQGTTGTQGIQGIVGTQGAQGTQGITGIQGAQGIQGVQGTQGLVGPSTAINATDVTTGTLYPVMVGAAGSNQTANVDTVGLSFDATGNILSTIGNVVANNVIATTIVDAASHTGTIVSVSGNITGGNVTTAGIITVNSGAAATAIVNGAGNAVGNIGSSSTYFNQLFAQATTALYADLAEMYESDADYAPGTVVSFGGSKEVTLTQISSDQRVAGVISTHPAHTMNSGIQGEFTVAVALTGRVPTSVIGTVAKGDMMVSAGNGYAQASATPAMGTVIGKALQDHHGPTGIIEIVVGRM